MDRFYFENALIRYIYKEADFFERFEVEHAIEYEEDVKKLYLELCELFDMLPKVKFVPSQNTLDNILSFSRSTGQQA